jgi:hypothetical protein
MVASGATLFAFVGAATHHPPRSVTDTEQPLIVAHRAAINCALDEGDRQRTPIIAGLAQDRLD